MLHLILDGTSSSSSSTTTSESTSSLSSIFSGPTIYIFLGAIVLIFLVFEIVKRFVSAKGNVNVIVIRDNKIYKVIKPGDKKYFLAFFKDKVGATIPLDEASVTTDKVLINNGPDALYKLHLAIKYKINDAVTFYPAAAKFGETFQDTLNDELREYAKKNGAEKLINTFDDNKDDVVSYLNSKFGDIAVEITDMKIKAIEPCGRN